VGTNKLAKKRHMELVIFWDFKSHFWVPLDVKIKRLSFSNSVIVRSRLSRF
jgi:hypothetical protein